MILQPNVGDNWNGKSLNVQQNKHDSSAPMMVTIVRDN